MFKLFGLLTIHTGLIPPSISVSFSTEIFHITDYALTRTQRGLTAPAYSTLPVEAVACILQRKKQIVFATRKITVVQRGRAALTASDEGDVIPRALQSMIKWTNICFLNYTC